jgi:hypothetical protein
MAGEEPALAHDELKTMSMAAMINFFTYSPLSDGRLT